MFTLIPTLLLLLFGQDAVGEVLSDYISGTTVAIGPDTYGIIAQYASLYKNEEKSLDEYDGSENSLSVDRYLRIVKSTNRLVDEIYKKYKQVNNLMISTSRFFYNYRHVGNVLSILARLRRFGLVSNRQVISMLPETCLCHPTNFVPGRIYPTSSMGVDDYEGKISDDKFNVSIERMEISYRGNGIRRDHFRYVMTDRYPKKYPKSVRMLTRYRVTGADKNSEDQYDLPTRFIFITGHGGDRYLQLQAKYSLSSLDFELYFKEMHIKNPHMKVLVILDTCQASTMFRTLDKHAPLAWVASSSRGQNSYSHNVNNRLSVSTVDRFSYYLSVFFHSALDGIVKTKTKASVSRLSLQQMSRFIERNYQNGVFEYHVNDALVSQGKEKGENQNIGKLYLGQFMFNYRIVYYDSYKFPVLSLDVSEVSLRLQGAKVSMPLFPAEYSESCEGRMVYNGLLEESFGEDSFYYVFAGVLFLGALVFFKIKPSQ